MATLRTMNRRRWRKANPAICVVPTMDVDSFGRLRSYYEAIRGGRWVRFSPRPDLDVDRSQ